MLRALEYRKKKKKKRHTKVSSLQYGWSCLLLVLQVPRGVLVSYSLTGVMAFLAQSSSSCIRASSQGVACAAARTHADEYGMNNCRLEGGVGEKRVSGLLPCVFQVLICTKIISGANRCKVEDFSCSRLLSYGILLSQGC